MSKPDFRKTLGAPGFDWMGHYLSGVDGTGYFSSSNVHCRNCCETHHRDRRTTYYHQLLGAVLVHPAHREVFPLAPEPIVKADGRKKNDCGRNAAKRFLLGVEVARKPFGARLADGSRLPARNNVLALGWHWPDSLAMRERVFHRVCAGNFHNLCAIAASTGS